MIPTFPLRAAPTCRRCGEPCTRDITKSSNRNGNVDRPYYTCIYGGHDRKFSTFDDSRGIFVGNPQCYCGYISRKGKTNGPDVEEFYSCPVGACGWSQTVMGTLDEPVTQSYGFQYAAITANVPANSGPVIKDYDYQYTGTSTTPGTTSGQVETTASNRFEEATPETNVFVAQLGGSYAQGSRLLGSNSGEVASSAEAVIKTKGTPVAAAVNGVTSPEARSRVDFDAQPFYYEMGTDYGNRGCKCCVIM